MTNDREIACKAMREIIEAVDVALAPKEPPVEKILYTLNRENNLLDLKLRAAIALAQVNGMAPPATKFGRG